MKKLIYGALFGLLLAIVMLRVGANSNGAPVLTYVYSNSMEPVIKVNDAFIVWPASELKVGDIIMYRPLVLKAPYITHRIIGVSEIGYITKGDNSPFKDQDSGEPEITMDRIIGKVLSMNGQPLILPGFGNLSVAIRSGLDDNAIYFSGIFLLVGITLLLVGNKSHTVKRKPRHRLRLHHIYKSIIIISIILVMISIYVGSRVSQVRYLVSEYPGSQGNQIAVNQPGILTMDIRNHGVVPVWTIPTGIEPLSVSSAPEYIWPKSVESIVLDVIPQKITGYYQGYVQVYHYPMLLPRSWVVYLHQINPTLAMIAIGLTFGFLINILFQCLNHIHGFEQWIPLKAIKDKLTRRRLKRVKSKFLGRRRVD